MSISFPANPVDGQVYSPGAPAPDYIYSAATTTWNPKSQAMFFPLAFVVPKLPAAGQAFNLALNIAMTLAANFANARVYSGVAPTGNAVFTINRISGGTVTPIGTITLTAGSQTAATFSTQAAAAFAAGDVLELVAPATQDATLADIGITLAATRS